MAKDDVTYKDLIEAHDQATEGGSPTDLVAVEALIPRLAREALAQLAAATTAGDLALLAGAILMGYLTGVREALTPAMRAQLDALDHWIEAERARRAAEQKDGDADR